MKGIAFTLDGIFALVIAGAGVSVLVYFYYAGQTPYLLQVSNAGSVAGILSSARIGSLSAVTFLSYISSQGAATNQTWPQYLKDQYASGSNGYGPQKPSVSYIIDVSNTILNNSIVADYGNVYFAANGIIYGYTSQGSPLWSKKASVSTLYSLALYNGELLYTDSGNVVALNAYNGTLLWRTNTTLSTGTQTPPVRVINGMALVGNLNDHVIEAFYAGNGTHAWTMGAGFAGDVVGNITSASGSIAYVNGTLVSLASFAGPTAPVKVWSKNLGSRPHGLSSSGTDIAFGYGTTAANIINIDGTNVITYSGTTAVYGTSIYKGVAYFQAASNVIAMNLGGTLLWDKGTAATYGTAMNGAYPVEGGQYLYTLWWNGTRDALTAQNLTNGTIMWKTTLPYAVRANPGMILAYGRLYLSDGSKLIAIGMCSGNPNSTLLASAATAYLNGYTGCASAILDSARPQVNYTMQLDRKSTIHTAKFNGVSSYIDVPNSQTLDNASAMSFSFWVNNAGGGTVLSKAHPSPELGQYWITITSGIVHYAIKQYWGDYNTGAAVPANTWTHVALVVSPSTTNALVYINGMLKSTQTNINNVPFAHGSTDLDIGRQNPENGGGGYFNGSLADVQIYNTSLTGAQVAQLYSEGMSGAPLTGAGVVGWWPLGGDANDYSGLYNSGFPVNVTYTSNSYSIGSLKNSYQASSSTIALPILNYTSMKYETHNVSIISWS